MTVSYENKIFIGIPLKTELKRMTIEKDNNAYSIVCNIEFYLDKQIVYSGSFSMLNVNVVKYAMIAPCLSRTTQESFTRKKKNKVVVYKSNRQKIADKFFTAVVSKDDLDKILCSCSLL